MASLSLRAYLQKIENLIDRGETEEAIAHCKHILKKFPKHVDTYRLLGKSYLEMQRYQEASDVLQRVLSVVPDDFVAQIGMSIIREDSSNLDEAIWHMERAFEIQPSNNAVQDELKRLYGRRDGVVPQKILLTRGALVRMYVRGEAYPQAIAEGIAALKEDPQRSDIQLLLAKSYLRTNQINEGYRICQKILEPLPYSYEANQLLAEIHILTKQSDQAEPYLERVRMLDPYAAFVNENAPTSAKVDENAIIIDELDYDEMAMALEGAETTNGSLYIDDDFDTSSLEIPTAGDSQPIEIDEDFSWMQEMMDGAESKKVQEKQSPQEINEEAQVFSWETSSGADVVQTEDAAAEFDPEFLFSEESSEDDNAFADLFKEMNNADNNESAETADQAEEDQTPMTMAEFFDSSTPQNGVDGSGENEPADEEFAALFGNQTPIDKQTNDADFAALFDESKIEESELSPDGTLEKKDHDFSALFDENNKTEAAPDVSEAVSTGETSDELPDWLRELDQETKDSDIEGDLQKEIDSLFTNGDLPTAQNNDADFEESEAKLDDEEEFAAKFLEELENEPQHPGKTRMFSMTADLSSGDSGPLPPLADDTAPAVKAGEEELPDWLKQLEKQTDQFSADEDDLSIQEEPIIDSQEQPAIAKSSSIDSMSEEEEELLREQYKAAQQSVNTTQILSEDEDDSFAWLESLAAKQNIADEEVGSFTQVDASDEVFAEETPSFKSASSIETMTDEEEDLLREQFKSSQQTSKATQMLSDEDDDSFAWLESLAAKQGAGAEVSTTEADIQPEPDIAEEPTADVVPEHPQKVSSSTIDSMTEEEEERLREQFKSVQQESKAAQLLSEDEDDSFAWLESLAAKQGVSEDTLLTNEDERTVETPEWLRESTEAVADTELKAPEHTALLNGLDGVEDLPEEEPVTISKLEQTEISEENETAAQIEEPIWVDEFSASELEAPKETQMLSPDTADAELIQLLEDDENLKTEEILPAVEELIEESVEEIEKEEQPEQIQKDIEAPGTPDEIPDWLKDLEDQTSIYAITDNEKAAQNILDIEDVEIPGWITDVNETQNVDLEDEDDGSFIPEVQIENMEIEADIEEEQSAESFTAVGLDISELEKQLEQEQIIEHIDGPKISTSDDVIEEAVEIHPGSSTEPMQEISQEEIEEIVSFDIPSDFVEEILQEPEPTGPVQTSEDDNNLLTEMGNLFTTDKVNDALTIADQLIEKEIHLENVIKELNKAIVDHPLDPAIFIRLGDAYIRNNEIQKALDMYQEAETLLQK